LRFKGALNAFGTAEIFLRAGDSAGGLSAVQSFTITIQPVNDAPSFTAGPNVYAIAGSGANTIPAWATNIDVGAENEAATQNPAFFIFNDNNALFANVDEQPRVLSDGTLLFTLADGARGSALVTVAVFDSAGGFSPPKTFRIHSQVQGDANLDGRVDLQDLNVVRNQFGAGVPGGAPVAGEAYPFDGVVNLQDLNAVRNHFGAGAPSPISVNSTAARFTHVSESNRRQAAADWLFQNWGNDDAALRPDVKKSAARRLLRP
jgi:hypothetical protein